MDAIIPVNLYKVPQTSPLFKPKYINNLIANGVIQDFFIPGIAAKNPLFSRTNDFNEKIGILQTATYGIEKILNYVDILKQLNPHEKEVINDIVKEINDTIKTTTFNSNPVFNQTLKIGNNKINLSIPTIDLNTFNIEEYEKLLTERKNDIFKVLENVSFKLPTNTNFNPYDTETFENILHSGLLVTAYKNNTINPLTLELLLS